MHRAQKDHAPGLRLAAHHRPADYAQLYRRARRLHIPNFLDVASARWLHAVLTGAVAWNTVLNTETSVYDFSPANKDQMTPEQWTAIERAVVASAANKFHFLFDSHRISETGEAYADPNHPLAQIVAFLNAPATLQFLRSVTGHGAIARVDAQATRYSHGQFLHIHDDLDPGKGRLAAYVLNMTPVWSAEWGGVLHFVDEDGHIAEGYVPKFNALNIFDVGVPHFVSYVAPFAQHPRLSVTGWLRAA
jgi:Rps23 Pro-64 3,4-dihydroxylase Tpa1-like proline 4-hydroxylase